MRLLLLGVTVALGGLVSACASSTGSYTPDSAQVAGQEAADDRQVVKRAWLDLEVADPSQAAAQIEAVVKKYGGLVEASTTSTDGALRLELRGDDAVRLALRVPASSLDEALAEMRRLGEVQRENISTTDVTDEVSDLDAQLTNLIAVRDRLRGYLDRAEDLEDVIAIERELTRVQAEIDSITSRLERLRSQVAASQVTVTLNRKIVLGPLGLLVSGVAWLVGKLFVIN